MYSDMSIRIIARSSSKRNSASARASSVFPTPVGPRKRNEPMGRLGSASLELAELLLERHQRAVAKLGGAVQIPAALRVGHRVPRRLDLLLDLSDPCDALLLGLPPRLEAVALFTELGQLRVDLREPLARDGVLLAREGDTLDLKLHDAAVDLVNFLRHRVDLHPDA